jgi:uncharacterized protein
VKVVFDTNVYLAAVAKADTYAWRQIKRSRPGGPYQIFISPEIILEIREKLEAPFGQTSTESAEFIGKLLLYADLVQPRRRVSGVLQDTDDHIILECAVEAKASAIVTADRGLLRLKEFEGIAIIHPTVLQYLK